MVVRIAKHSFFSNPLPAKQLGLENYLERDLFGLSSTSKLGLEVETAKRKYGTQICEFAKYLKRIPMILDVTPLTSTVKEHLPFLSKEP